jgi:TetR/AcrR family transcriptional repressor of nem operon
VARNKQHPSPTTAERILDVAEGLVQKRGFNGFSYADIAAALDLTTASLHYHFPSKADLGRALIQRYSRRFFAALEEIRASLPGAFPSLQAYVKLYADVLREERLCLCGMLAAEFGTLPETMREAVLGFFDENETWLAELLDEGRAAGQLRFEGSAAETARMVLCALEGAMLVTRPYGDLGRFDSAAAQLIAGFRSSPGAGGGLIQPRRQAGHGGSHSRGARERRP